MAWQPGGEERCLARIRLVLPPAGAGRGIGGSNEMHWAILGGTAHKSCKGAAGVGLKLEHPYSQYRTVRAIPCMPTGAVTCLKAEREIDLGSVEEPFKHRCSPCF
jgi:hypothetical protein